MWHRCTQLVAKWSEAHPCEIVEVEVVSLDRREHRVVAALLDQMLGQSFHAIACYVVETYSVYH